MRFITIIFLAITICCSLGCEDDTGGAISATSDMHIQFIATYDGDPLIMDEVYNYEDGFRVSFSEFKFFVSYLSLIHEDETTTPLSDIQFIDFTEINKEPVTALDGVEFDFFDIPVGTYTGIKLGIGVVADLNRTQPDEYGNTHPLYDSDNYRPASDSYIFTKICGVADLNGDNEFNHSLIYEILNDPMYREVLIDGALVLQEATTETLKLNVDLKKLFVRSPVSYLDIQTNNIVFDDEVIMKYISDNFQNAFTLE